MARASSLPACAGGAGILTVVTSATGFFAADNGSPCCLSLYSFELVVMLVVQIAVVALVWKYHIHIPEDQREAADSKFLHFLEKQERVSKWLALGIFGIQVACIMLACVLKSMRWRPRDEFDELDMDDRTQPLLRVSKDLTPGRKANDPWSQRMHEQYGLDTSKFSYRPLDALGDGEGSPRSAKSRGCAIM